ncbi:hypothetical protein [Bradyrhizobium sp. sGM-13]|uniref:hypothetical protein n=1 Tax=Bradyrhizobium sp. sGM-13 TaxID=2831781 RepID=UPI0020C02B44|nr:hypothetical protein [Bradyrhizobium sp. sGM-13]
MTTPARYRALQWLRDHEADPLSVLLRKRPSARMCNLMEREHQVVRAALGQFNHYRWLLTGMGAQVLADKTRGQDGRRQRKTRTSEDAEAQRDSGNCPDCADDAGAHDQAEAISEADLHQQQSPHLVR